MEPTGAGRRRGRCPLLLRLLLHQLLLLRHQRRHLLLSGGRRLKMAGGRPATESWGRSATEPRWWGLSHARGRRRGLARARGRRRRRRLAMAWRGGRVAERVVLGGAIRGRAPAIAVVAHHGTPTTAVLSPASLGHVAGRRGRRRNREQGALALATGDDPVRRR